MSRSVSTHAFGCARTIIPALEYGAVQTSGSVGDPGIRGVTSNVTGGWKRSLVIVLPIASASRSRTSCPIEVDLLALGAIDSSVDSGDGVELGEAIDAPAASPLPSIGVRGDSA